MKTETLERLNEILGEGHDLFQQPWRDEYLVACLLDSYLRHNVQEVFRAFECNKGKDFTIEGWDFVNSVVPRSLLKNCTFISCTFTGCVGNPFYPDVGKFLITGNTKFIRCHISQSNWEGLVWSGTLEFEDCTLQSVSLEVGDTLSLKNTILEDSIIEGNPNVVNVEMCRFFEVEWKGIPKRVLIYNTIFSNSLLSIKSLDSEIVRVQVQSSKVELKCENVYIHESCFENLKPQSLISCLGSELEDVQVLNSSQLLIDLINCRLNACVFRANTYSFFRCEKNVVTETFWENNVYKEGRIFDSEFLNSSFKGEMGDINIQDVEVIASEYLGCELEIDSQSWTWHETVVKGSCFQNSSFDKFKGGGCSIQQSLFQDCLWQDFEIMETFFSDTIFYTEEQGSLSGGVFSSTRFEKTIFLTSIQKVNFFFTGMKDCDLTGSLMSEIYFHEGEFENNLYDLSFFKMVQGFQGD